MDYPLCRGSPFHGGTPTNRAEEQKLLFFQFSRCLLLQLLYLLERYLSPCLKTDLQEHDISLAHEPEGERQR